MLNKELLTSYFNNWEVLGGGKISPISYKRISNGIMCKKVLILQVLIIRVYSTANFEWLLWQKFILNTLINSFFIASYHRDNKIKIIRLIRVLLARELATREERFAKIKTTTMLYMIFQYWEKKLFNPAYINRFEAIMEIILSYMSSLHIKILWKIAPTLTNLLIPMWLVSLDNI